MAPHVARDLAVSYGGFSVGGSTERLLDGEIRLSKSFETAVVRFSFLVTGTTDANFASACVAAEAAFRVPHGNLTVTQNSQTLLTLSHSANTGFEGAPEIDKENDPANTGRSRIYDVRIEFGMPADGATVTGLRESSIDVSFSASRRRTVTFSGVFTAVSSNDARAQYDAEVDTWTAAALSAFGGTYEKIDETSEEDTEDKLLSFSQVYEEIIFAQGAESPLNDTDLVRQSLRITKRIEAPGDSPYLDGGESSSIVLRLVTATAEFEAWVDSEQTTNLTAKWASIRAWLIEKTRTVLDAGSFALIEEEPSFDFDDNRISARIVLRGATSTEVLEHTVEVEDALETGVVLVPVWSGNPIERYRYDGPATYRRTVVQRTKYLNSGIFDVAIGTAKHRGIVSTYEDWPKDPAPAASPDGTVWARITRRVRVRPVTLGFDGKQIPTTELEATTVLELYKPAGGSKTATGGGPAGGVTGGGRTPSGGSSGSGSRQNIPGGGR